MKKITLLLLLSVIISEAALAQQQKLKQVLTLQMPKTIDDDMPGTRGASVVWHPIFKKYYACFAGNISYPFGIFNVKGELLSDPNLSCNNDVRGLWYNPINKTIAGNAYADGGWFEYTLNAKGMITETKTVIDKKNQPQDQSVGCYNSAENKILFLDAGVVKQYDAKGFQEKIIDIYWGQSIKPKEAILYDEMPEAYNNSNIIFLEKPQKMIGALNIENKTIEWYYLKNGLLAKTYKLPDDAPTPSFFNVAYANNIVWLFDIDNRKWIGYK